MKAIKIRQKRKKRSEMTEAQLERHRQKKEQRLLNQQIVYEAGKGPMDLPFLLLTLLLTGIGLIMLLSASFPYAYYKLDGDSLYFFKRQLRFACAGIAIMLFIGRINYMRLKPLGAVLAMLISIGLLGLVLVPGVGVTHNNATRWLNFGFEFQPSEVAKLGVILLFSATASKKAERLHHFSTSFLAMVEYIVILGIVLGLLWKEPHLSGMVLIAGIGASILFAAGLHWSWIAGGLAVVAGFCLAYLNGKIAYNATRITIWKDPLNAEWMKGEGYQIRQSLLAIGSGGLLGTGLGKSRQKYLFLPERHNDFIFSIVCEELGFIGASLIIVLFILLIIRGYWIAIHARNRFGGLIAVGVTTQIALQVFLNIAVVSNLVPNTGISLPFFSYGGTALIIQLAEMGLVLSVSRQMPPS